MVFSLFASSLFSAHATEQSRENTHIPKDRYQTGPSVIEVPAESTLEVSPPEGWSFQSCKLLQDASKLITACTPDAFTVTTPKFDPNIRPVRVPVTLQNEQQKMIVDYVIQLALPEPPNVADTELSIPVQRTRRSLIPISELGIRCALCHSKKAQLSVRSVSPKSAGEAWFTGSHLVFQPASDATGTVKIMLRLHDDIKQASNTGIVTLHISNTRDPQSSMLHGLHINHSLTSATDLHIEHLLLAQPGVHKPLLPITDSDITNVRIIQCGSALYGTVTCRADGSIHYEPPVTHDHLQHFRDQFAVSFTNHTGSFTTGSVTITNEPSILSAGNGSQTNTLSIDIPQPPTEGAEQTSSGVTDGFRNLMNTLGA